MQRKGKANYCRYCRSSPALSHCQRQDESGEALVLVWPLMLFRASDSQYFKIKTCVVDVVPSYCNPDVSVEHQPNRVQV